ncbi:MAG: SMI1/KNR4 family protein [Anaerolineae bacterium]|nr:SMI1/KNR4 family protein [Anaerolineae bacterium]
MPITVQQMKERFVEWGLSNPTKMWGCTQEEIDRAMQAQGVTFLPAFYREYLLEIGYEVEITIFQGEDCTCEWLPSLKNMMKENMAFLEVPFTLPQDAFVFFAHQGTIFSYFHTGEQDEDPAVFVWADTREPPVQRYDHLTDFYQKAIDLKEWRLGRGNK